MASLEFVYLPKTAINEPFLFTGKEKCPESIIDLSQVQLRLHQRWNMKIFSWLHCCNVKDNDELFVWSFYIDIRTFYLHYTEIHAVSLKSNQRANISHFTLMDTISAPGWHLFDTTDYHKETQGTHNTLIQIWELYAYRTHETRFVRFSVP